MSYLLEVPLLFRMLWKVAKTIDATIRKWGNSYGVIIPKEVAAKEGIKEKQRVRVLILQDNKNLRKSFGTARKILDKPAKELKDESRRELYDE